MSEPQTNDLQAKLDALKKDIENAESHVRNHDQDGHFFPKKDESKTKETPPPL